MSPTSLDLAVQLVLDQFEIAGLGTLLSLGNHGGFSGARLWRVEGAGGPFCLKAWAPGTVSPEHLERIHRLMKRARQAGLIYVPAVQATRTHVSSLEHEGRLWDLTTWLPGRADFRARPTNARLEAACTALARLHLAWGTVAAGLGPCPALERRLRRTREWLNLLESGWRPDFSGATGDPVDAWAERAWRLLAGRVERVADRLAPWQDRDFPLQMCLCDVRHDHVLFEGDGVTGIVDYASVREDHVTADLARLLGDLAGDDERLRSAGLEAYGRLRPLGREEEGLVTVLYETGVLLGAANWLRWLYQEERQFEDRRAVAARLAELVGRIEGWGNPL